MSRVSVLFLTLRAGATVLDSGAMRQMVGCIVRSSLCAGRANLSWKDQEKIQPMAREWALLKET